MIKDKIYRLLSGEISSTDWWNIRCKAKKRGLIGLFYKYKYYSISRKSCASIPLQTKIGNSPQFPHGITGIFISMGAIIGKNTIIMQFVTIGSNTFKDSKHHGSPLIGNNVFIGAGAKIIGGITIGDNVRIGANCVVTTDIPDNTTVVMEKPRVITHNIDRQNKFVSWSDYNKI